MPYLVQKITDGADIDLESLSVPELERLHFDEEAYTAERMRKTVPFSKEREILANRGYRLVSDIMHVRERKQGKEKYAFGASAGLCRLVGKIVSWHQRRTARDPLRFFEAGVGTGKVLESLARLSGVRLIGCDIYLDPRLKNREEFELYEGPIDDVLRKIDNSSLDVFYWNDVVEHLLEDEIDEHIKTIEEKIAGGGLIVTSTPNRLIGPHDITRRLFPPGTPAQGFHFKEYTYTEFVALMQRHRFVEKCSVLVNPLSRNMFLATTSPFGVACLRQLRKASEFIAPAIKPFFLRRMLLLGLVCHLTVFQKS